MNDKQVVRVECDSYTIEFNLDQAYAFCRAAILQLEPDDLREIITLCENCLEDVAKKNVAYSCIAYCPTNQEVLDAYHKAMMERDTNE